MLSEAVCIAGIAAVALLSIQPIVIVLNYCYVIICNKFYTLNLKTKFGTWAVVTGGTDGIGKSYARELARRGVNLVIISRNIDKLNKVASDIEEEFGVDTRVIQVDFSVADSQSYLKLQGQLKDLDIGVLVNNVGVVVPYPQPLSEMSDELIWQHVNVNVAAITLMTRLVLPAMKQRRRGVIVNLSSTTAVAPTPYLGVYAATKAYVEYFSAALRAECRSYNVHVQTLRPFYVNTQMVSYSDQLSAGGLMVPSPDVYARHVVNTLGLVGATCGYLPHSLMYWVTTLMPWWMWMPIADAANKNFRQAYDKKQKKQIQCNGDQGKLAEIDAIFTKFQRRGSDIAGLKLLTIH